MEQERKTRRRKVGTMVEFQILIFLFAIVYVGVLSAMQRRLSRQQRRQRDVDEESCSLRSLNDCNCVLVFGQVCLCMAMCMEAKKIRQASTGIWNITFPWRLCREEFLVIYLSVAA